MQNKFEVRYKQFENFETAYKIENGIKCSQFSANNTIKFIGERCSA